MLTVSRLAASFNLDNAPPVTTVITDELRRGGEVNFFTSSSITSAIMFSYHGAGGALDGDLFFGQTVLQHNGTAGFLPVVTLEGMTGGAPVGDLAVDYVHQNGSSDGLIAVLLSGDDTLIGNRIADNLSGGEGNDLIIGGASQDVETISRLDGGEGNDVIHAYGRSEYQRVQVIGGSGRDFLFAYNGDLYLDGGKGRDTLFVAPGGDYQINEFTKADRIQLDPSIFKSLVGGVTSDNIAVGSTALDNNDYIIDNVSTGGYHIIYYDADGSGKGSAVEICYFTHAATGLDHGLSASNFIISDAVPIAGNHGGLSSSRKVMPI